MCKSKNDSSIRHNEFDDLFSDLEDENQKSDISDTKTIKQLTDENLGDKDRCEVCKSTVNILDIPTGLNQDKWSNTLKLCKKHAVELKLNEIHKILGEGESIIEQRLYAEKICQVHIQNKDDNDHEAEKLLNYLYSHLYELARPKQFVSFSNGDLKKIEGLKKILPNASAFIEYIKFSLFASKNHIKGKRRVIPIMLLGRPGVGKTFTAKLLAKTLNIGFQSLQISTIQGGFEFSGVSSKWRTPSLGSFTQSLMKFQHQTGIILLDEIDKASQSDEHGSIYDGLLHLLEEDSCNSFQNNLIELPMTSEDIIWIATANSLAKIPSAIISRFHVITIENLNSIQIRGVFDSIYNENCKLWKLKGYQCQTIDKELYQLADNISIRELKQIIDLAVKKSAYENQKNKVISLSRSDFIDEHIVHQVFSNMSKNIMSMH